MPYFVKLEIVDGGAAPVTRTFSKAEVEFGSFGDVAIEDDGFSSYEFKILVLPEGLFLFKDWDHEELMLNGVPAPKVSPLALGDVITQGGTSSIKVVGMGDEHELPKTGERYLAVRILDKCPSCGGGLPMNGLLSEVRCDMCHKTANLKPGYWESVLGTVLEDIHQEAGGFSLNFSTDVSWKVKAPECPKCSAELPVEGVPTGAVDDLICPSCGARASTYPSPEWMKQLLPSIAQVFCGRRAAAAGEGDIRVVGAKPVVLSCPSCGGSLKVTSESERTVTCGYCDADVYLPDDLWSRLHPKKTAATWYLRLEGKTKKERGDEWERERKIAEAREAMSAAARYEKAVASSKVSSKLNVIIPIVLTLIPVGITLAVVFGHLTGEDLGPSAADLDPGAPVPAGGMNWSPDMIQGTRVATGTTPFALNAPAGVTPLNDGTSIIWQNPSNAAGAATLTVTVTGMPRTPATTNEAATLAATKVGAPTSNTSTAALPDGHTVTLRSASSDSTNVFTYKRKPGLPPGSPGLECRATLKTNTAAPPRRHRPRRALPERDLRITDLGVRGGPPEVIRRLLTTQAERTGSSFGPGGLARYTPRMRYLLEELPLLPTARDHAQGLGLAVAGPGGDEGHGVDPVAADGEDVAGVEDGGLLGDDGDVVLALLQLHLHVELHALRVLGAGV